MHSLGFVLKKKKTQEDATPEDAVAHREAKAHLAAEGAALRASAREAAVRQHEQQLKEVFDIFDTNGSGFISVRAAKAAMSALGFKAEKEDVLNMTSDSGQGDSGAIKYEGFLNLMMHKFLNRRPKDELLKFFRLVADSETGKMSVQSCQSASEKHGHT